MALTSHRDIGAPSSGGECVHVYRVVAATQPSVHKSFILN